MTIIVLVFVITKKIGGAIIFIQPNRIVLVFVRKANVELVIAHFGTDGVQTSERSFCYPVDSVQVVQNIAHVISLRFVGVFKKNCMVLQ